MKKRFLFLSLFSIISIIFSNQTKAFEYGGFGIRPVDLETGIVKKDVSGFVYEIDLGKSKKDGFMVVNNTKEKKTFLVYVADSVKSTDGGFACKQFSEEKKNVASWIKLSKNEVTLEPGTNEIISFLITLPKDKIDAGEHNGCFLVQEKKETKNEKDSKSGIQLSIRTGVRISVIVPGDLSKKISINNFDFSKKSDKFNFNVAVKNDGNISSDTNVKVIIKSIFGIKHKELGGKYLVLRNEKSVWNFILNKPFWGGFYKAKLFVEYNPEAKGSLDVDKDKLTILQSDKNFLFFSFPSTRGLILEIVILLFILFNLYLLSIYKRRKDWIKTWKKYTITRTTNIKVLAEKYNINWKILANANKIKAPYMLSAKEEIRVPNDLEEEYNSKKPSLLNKIKLLFSKKQKKRKSYKKRK